MSDLSINREARTFNALNCSLVGSSRRPEPPVQRSIRHARERLIQIQRPRIRKLNQSRAIFSYLLQQRLIRNRHGNHLAAVLGMAYGETLLADWRRRAGESMYRPPPYTEECPARRQYLPAPLPESAPYSKPAGNSSAANLRPGQSCTWHGLCVSIVNRVPRIALKRFHLVLRRDNGSHQHATIKSR